jgi:hypothetical protein
MTIAELRRLGRTARGNWTGLIVVLAGALSALAAIANLTLWVSLSAAFAAVLGGLRVIYVQLLVPAQLETVNAYLQAIGGTARMIVSFADGHETTLDLSQLA